MHSCRTNIENNKWFKKDLETEKTIIITSQWDQQRSREMCSNQASENVWTNPEVQEYQPGTILSSKFPILKSIYRCLCKINLHCLCIGTKL